MGTHAIIILYHDWNTFQIYFSHIKHILQSFWAFSLRILKLFYHDIQRDLQMNSPYAVLFQQAEQTVMQKNVDGFVSGSNFDLVFYRSVKK